MSPGRSRRRCRGRATECPTLCRPRFPRPLRSDNRVPGNRDVDAGLGSDGGLASAAGRRWRSRCGWLCRCLRWCEVKPDRLTLIDAKTGPRHVLLGEAARELLNGLAETASGEWVFPGGKGNGPLSTDDLWRFWIKARDAAGIVTDARLHDPCHAHASPAVMNGESLHVAGRLLGHRRATTTNRYVHLDDATLSQAAERVAVERKLRESGFIG